MLSIALELTLDGFLNPLLTRASGMGGVHDLPDTSAELPEAFVVSDHQPTPNGDDPTGADGESTRLDALRRMITANLWKSLIAIVLVPLILGVFFIYLTNRSSGTNAVSGEQAVAAERDRQDEVTAAAVVSDVYDSSSPATVSTEAPNLEDVDVSTSASVREDGEYDLPDGLSEAETVGKPVVDGRNGMLLGFSNDVRFTLTGLRNKPERIRSMRAELVGERRPAPRGTLVYWVPQGAAENPNLAFDLTSETSAEAQAVVERGAPLGDFYFHTHTVTLAKDEPMGFNVEFRAENCQCQAKIIVEFADGSELEVTREGGKLFNVDSLPRGRKYRQIYVPQFAPDGRTVLTRCPSLSSCHGMAYGQKAPRPSTSRPSG